MPFADRSAGMICDRCGQPTGNDHQGHMSTYCRITGAFTDLHLCCPSGCELHPAPGTQPERSYLAGAQDIGLDRPEGGDHDDAHLGMAGLDDADADMIQRALDREERERRADGA